MHEMSKVGFNAIVGTNLNHKQLRGFARLDVLSAISEADQYDQELNPQGTQRDLNIPHARAIATYARTVVLEPERPAAFPEVLLNVRKSDAIASIKRNGERVGFEDLEDGDVVSLEIDAALTQRSKGRHDPAISRVDGNHRLAAAEFDAEDGEEWPSIPFAMFVGISKRDERSLFAAINGNQKRMDTSHLSNIAAALGGDAMLLNDKTMPLWFADKLSQPGRIFHDRVFKGGSKEGVKKTFGFVPPLKLKQLETAMKYTLSELGLFLPEFLSSLHEAREGSQEAGEQLVKQAELLANAIERYWIAVSRAYPDAWAENAGKKHFILFQSVGFTPFARLAGKTLIQMGQSKIKTSQENFDNELMILANSFSLDVDDFAGLAGGAGANRVLERLTDAKDSQSSGMKWSILED